MHVGVHADAGLAEAHRDDEVGGLAAHTVEREQLVDRVGDAAAEALEQIAADAEDDARFRAVPKVLETPKEPEPIADLRNLATLRRLRRGISVRT